jgi:hypothetical protein
MASSSLARNTLAKVFRLSQNMHKGFYARVPRTSNFDSCLVVARGQPRPWSRCRAGVLHSVGAIVLGFVNAIIRPLMVLLTLPFTILTFGLAFLGSLVLTFLNMAVTLLIPL